MSKLENNSQQEEIIKYLKANLILRLCDLNRDEAENVKPELLLNRAGFSHKEIASLLGKNSDAVRKAISREKNGTKESRA